MKNGICTIVGVVGSFIVSLFGGWDTALVTLMIFMVVDYITGLVVSLMCRHQLYTSKITRHIWANEL